MGTTRQTLELLISEFLGFLLVATLVGGLIGYLIGVEDSDGNEKHKLENKYLGLLQERHRVQAHEAARTDKAEEVSTVVDDAHQQKTTANVRPNPFEFAGQLKEQCLPLTAPPLQIFAAGGMVLPSGGELDEASITSQVLPIPRADGNKHVLLGEEKEPKMTKETEAMINLQRLPATNDDSACVVADVEIYEVIRTRAHQLWLQQGQPDGCSEEHWHQAEVEVLSIRSGVFG